MKLLAFIFEHPSLDRLDCNRYGNRRHRTPFQFQVLKVKMQGNMVSEVVEVYADNDGSEMFGAGAATLVRDKLVIGAVWDQLIICDVKYVE